VGSLISKSKYLAGLQCPKLLWTQYNDKAAIPATSPATQAIFHMGHEIGRLAQGLWPGGVEGPQSLTDLPATVAGTQELMRRRIPVFEASFLVDGRYCRVDVLEPTDDDEWSLVEVKSSTKIKPVNLDDVAFQADTLRRAGVNLRRLSLMHVDNQYVRRGEIDPGGLLHAEDVTGLCLPRMDSIAQRVAAMHATIAGTRPDTPIGPHCDDPYECPLKPACWDWLPPHSVATIRRASNTRVFAWLGQGVTELTDVPDHELSKAQLVQKAAVLSGSPQVRPAGIRTWLGRLRYPLHLLDFETIGSAIPLFDGTRPYQIIPFQFSLHVLASPGAEPVHFEFLAETPDDPRPALLDALRRIGPDGTVLAYNMAFETRVLNELAGAFPDRSGFCRDLIARMDDLIRPFRAFDLYHPDQSGSCSIKAVLPAFTGHGYEALDIKEGGQASGDYLRAVYGGAPLDEKTRILESLRVYCRQDTFAMVELLRVLERYT
jgi:hypothetical protein